KSKLEGMRAGSRGLHGYNWPLKARWVRELKRASLSSAAATVCERMANTRHSRRANACWASSGGRGILSSETFSLDTLSIEPLVPVATLAIPAWTLGSDRTNRRYSAVKDLGFVRTLHSLSGRKSF